MTSMFLAMAIITALIAGWLHFRIDYASHTEVANTRRNRLLASTPLLVVSLIMVLVSVGSMAKGFAQRYPGYTNGKANLAALTSGLSRPVAPWPMTSWSKRMPTPACCSPRRDKPAGSIRAAGRGEPDRLHPQWRQRDPRPGSALRRQPRHRQFRRLTEQTQCRHRVHRRNRRWIRTRRRQRLKGVPCPSAWIPKPPR